MQHLVVTGCFFNEGEIISSWHGTFVGIVLSSPTARRREVEASSCHSEEFKGKCTSQFEPVERGIENGLYSMWQRVTISHGVRGDVVALEGWIKIKEEIAIV